MSQTFDLPMIWALIIAFAIFAYVVMDGFDLGIGIIFPLFKTGAERDQAMNSIAPIWDGNETWLVLGGGGLMAAFPLAYAIILPATYPLIIAMLLGLVFRGVAFEFRWRDPGHRRYWDIAFSCGSMVAALSQGILLGAILQGIDVTERSYSGGWWDWLTPFSMLTGISLVSGYSLLGASWLIGKTHDGAEALARHIAFFSALATLACIAGVSIATLFLSADYKTRWFEMPGVLFTAQVPIMTAMFACLYFWSLRRAGQFSFAIALVLFALCYIGLGISIYPYAVPGQLTIWDTAAPDSSLLFMLVGTIFVLPLILTYTAWAYYVFRGKTVIEGYH